MGLQPGQQRRGPGQLPAGQLPAIRGADGKVRQGTGDGHLLRENRHFFQGNPPFFSIIQGKTDGVGVYIPTGQAAIGDNGITSGQQVHGHLPVFPGIGRQVQGLFILLLCQAKIRAECHGIFQNQEAAPGQTRCGGTELTVLPELRLPVRRVQPGGDAQGPAQGREQRIPG